MKSERTKINTVKHGENEKPKWSRTRQKNVFKLFFHNNNHLLFYEIGIFQDLIPEKY